MDYELSALSDLDIFFYYDEPESDVNMEIQSDLIAGILQSKRSLFYNRRDSAGVPDKENYPNSFILAFLTRYDIVNWNGWRNTIVSDGSSGSKDRRIALSQNSIDILANGQELNLKVNYILFGNVKKTGQMQIPISS